MEAAVVTDEEEVEFIKDLVRDLSDAERADLVLWITSEWPARFALSTGSAGGGAGAKKKRRPYALRTVTGWKSEGRGMYRVEGDWVWDPNKHEEGTVLIGSCKGMSDNKYYFLLEVEREATATLPNGIMIDGAHLMEGSEDWDVVEKFAKMKGVGI